MMLASAKGKVYSIVESKMVKDCDLIWALRIEPDDCHLRLARSLKIDTAFLLSHLQHI